MATSSTADLVDEVLKNMRAAAASGDPDAIGKLTGMLTPAGKVGPGGAKAPAAPTPPPSPSAVTITETTVLRPNGMQYHVRKLGIHDDIAVLRKAREQNLYVLTYGPPGTGKTALIEAAFTLTSTATEGETVILDEQPIYTVQGSGDTEVADFIGGYTQQPDGSFLWVDGPLIMAMIEGKPLYIDEIALIDPKVMAIVYGVMDGRDQLRITANPARGVVKAAKGFYVVAACNPNAPGARMSEALLSRFPVQFEITTDYNLARKMGVDPKVVTAALNINKKMVNDGDISWAPQLRELLAYKAIEAEFGRTMALANLVSNAPENDRPVVADVLTRSMGETVSELRLG